MEITWIGILLLLPLLWLVLAVFDVQRGAFGTSGAARAAARAYALAPNDQVGEERARAAARLALADQGVEGEPVLSFDCTPRLASCHSGTAVVTVRVRTTVELPGFPDVFGGGTPRFRLDSAHTVPIGRFREIDGG
ncbi:hypothetical protein [Nocardioides sp. GY 10113]|uniref:hypothetical protein n=1 Tax=Nocardioides sp. GY 10113 TaxID=2569761 RepID=UPI001F0F25BD|nr:hypothetical protein [Nocardioides sp. GY 10113]